MSCGLLISLATSIVLSREPISPLFCNTLALCAMSKLQEMTPSELSAVISALGKLRAPIPWKVIAVILDHYRSILHQISSQEEVASVVCALSGLCYPNRDILKHKRQGLLKVSHLRTWPYCVPGLQIFLLSIYTSSPPQGSSSALPRLHPPMLSSTTCPSRLWIHASRLLSRSGMDEVTSSMLFEEEIGIR